MNIIKKDMSEVFRMEKMMGIAGDISSRIYDYLYEVWFNHGLDKNPKNLEYEDKSKTFLNNTKEALNLIRRESIYKDIVEALLNVFYRLTSYSSGSFVSLFDLIDLPTAIFMSKQIFGDTTEDFLCLRNWKLMIEGLLFTLYSMEIEFPAPYYPGLGVLEKKDTLQQALIDLEKSFQFKRENKV